MTETVVHVTTLEQWDSVLDVWFKQGYKWYSGSKEYQEDYFNSGSCGLWLTDDNMISMANTAMHDCIEYADFIPRQKEEPLTTPTPTEEPDANREVTIVFQNGEMKSFTGVTDISLNNGTLTFNYPQGAFGNTIMEATFYTDTISGYLTNSI